MEGSRSSSRLRENLKLKFKNTSNTPVSVDDDDFVSPPPCQKLGNKQGAVDAGQKPKFTKGTASRMPQDQSKGMQVGGQKEITKKTQKFFCIYLKEQRHPKHSVLWKMEPRVMKLNWQVQKKSTDCRQMPFL
ncbi:hypothetical protein L1887_21093 [Cichorium endivia]|nr:hypothetical protein L1887_21093 [Cichorium endivia]